MIAAARQLHPAVYTKPEEHVGVSVPRLHSSTQIHNQLRHHLGALLSTLKLLPLSQTISLPLSRTIYSPSSGGCVVLKYIWRVSQLLTGLTQVRHDGIKYVSLSDSVKPAGSFGVMKVNQCCSDLLLNRQGPNLL